MDYNLKFDGTKKELRKILDLYKLKVLNIDRLKHGIENTSYFLEMEGGLKLVLRVYKNDGKSNETIEKELKFMDNMRDSGIPIPLIVSNIFDKKLTIFKDSSGIEWKAIVMMFAEGRHLEPGDFNIIPEFALCQAKMHLISEKLNKNSDASNFKAMVDWLDKEFNKTKSKNLTNEILEKIGKVYNELKLDIEDNYEKILLLPYGNVHLDYDSDNVIVDDGKIKAILDFDDISMQPFVLDIANSIWWWLFKNKSEDYKKILQDYFNSYKKVRSITGNEKNFLGLFLRMRNLTLMCLLYINMAEEVNYIRANQCISLDSILKKLL